MFRCLHDGCDIPIYPRRGATTRRGKKRDHFWHLGNPAHETGGESDDHLAAKAMIEVWARQQVGDAASVAVERTVRDESGHRRPDVLVEWAAGERLAVEVEYKSLAVPAWKAKQSDLDALDVSVCWLVGHTRLRAVPGTADEERLVRLPSWAWALAERDGFVLAVNPTERWVGTCVDPLSGGPVRKGSDHVRLLIDPVSDCTLSPDEIVTPSLVEGRKIPAQPDDSPRAQVARWMHAVRHSEPRCYMSAGCRQRAALAALRGNGFVFTDPEPLPTTGCPVHGAAVDDS